jgi:hypothetical protein
VTRKEKVCSVLVLSIFYFANYLRGGRLLCTVRMCCSCLLSQSNQSAGPVRFLIFYSIRIFLLASPVAGKKTPSGLLVQISRECTPPYLSTGISNLLQPAQAEVVLGQLSTYLASWSAVFSLIAPRPPERHSHTTGYIDIGPVIAKHFFNLISQLVIAELKSYYCIHRVNLGNNH